MAYNPGGSDEQVSEQTSRRQALLQLGVAGGIFAAMATGFAALLNRLEQAPPIKDANMERLDQAVRERMAREAAEKAAQENP